MFIKKGVDFMKRAISFMVVLSIALTSCVIYSTALDVETSAQTSDVEAQVMEEVQKAFDELGLEYGYSLSGGILEKYVDIWDYYCHFVDGNTIDYVYVHWSTNGGSDACAGDRYLDYCVSSPRILRPTIGLYIYDVENKKIYTFKEAEIYATDYLKDFLDNHRNEVGHYYTVYKCGDMDLDDEVSIIDATIIQCALAQTGEFPWYDAHREQYNKEYDGTHYIAKVYYVSDFDFDGERSVLDATAIQMHLAGIDC